MPFQLSPGVNVTEVDLTTVIPAVATTDAAIGGVFRWGPVEKSLLISSEDALVSRYGKPSNLNAETFFSASSFLAYGNKLNVSRASHTTGTIVIEDAEVGDTTAVTVTEVNLGLVGGEGVFGDNIPEGTTVVSASENGANTDVVLSQAATGPNTPGTVQLQFFDADYSFNAIANTNVASLPGQIVKNDDHYDTVTFDSDVQWVAKYPGQLGNSLKVSVCDTATAFETETNLTTIDAANTSTATFAISVGSKTATITIANTASGDANSGADSMQTALNTVIVGDQVKIGNTTIGVQYLQVESIGAITKVEALAVETGTVTATLTFKDSYGLAVDFSGNTLSRKWEFWESVDAAPGQTTFQSQQGNTSAQDELHVVVADENGAFSGVPGTILEVFDGLSRGSNVKGEDGSTLYYKEVINQSSKYLWWAGDRSNAGSASALNLTSSTNVNPYTKSLVGGRDTKGEDTIAIADLINSYNLFKSAEDIDISLVLAGKARGGTHGEQLANYIVDNICEARKDCIAFISPDKSDVVNITTGDTEARVVEFRNSCRSTSYATLDSGYKYAYDKYNDIYRWVPLNGDVAGLCAATDQVRDAWWSPAGFNRGAIKNVVKLAWNPIKAQRDIIYKNGINPVVNFPGNGIILFGDKTLLSKPSAFDRINVRRLFIVLEKAIATSAKFTLFEFNDAFTRASFVNLVTPFLRDVQGRRGIYDFAVVCDESNNTGEVIDRNEFVGDIFIKPAKSINFIQLNFVAVRTGVEFSEVIGNI